MRGRVSARDEVIANLDIEAALVVLWTTRPKQACRRAALGQSHLGGSTSALWRRSVLPWTIVMSPVRS
jgi:hypothetical protein